MFTPTLDDSINWARLLAEAAEDTLCHVDIVSSCPAKTEAGALNTLKGQKRGFLS